MDEIVPDPTMVWPEPKTSNNVIFFVKLQGEEPEDTMMWFKTLQFYTQCLGGWRKRRKGLANIMIDPNLVSAAASAQESGNAESESASGSGGATSGGAASAETTTE